MNKGKKDLVTWAIILCFLTALSSVAYAIMSAVAIDKLYSFYGLQATMQQLEEIRVGEIVTYSLDAAINVAAAVCLIFYLKKVETNLVVAKRLFFAGLILNVFASPLAIASILLYIAHFKYPDNGRVQADYDEEVVANAGEDELKRKIEKLRKLKEDGTITEEEFEKELLKLL